MAKKDEVIAKKTTKVSLYVGPSGTSTIVRSDGMPQIIDKTEKNVEWLAAKGFKPVDIELVGEKPANWDTVFEIAPVVDPVVVPAAVQEPLAA
jgi:hypothetical protein